MANQNGLFTSRDVAGSGNPDSVFFIRNEDPVVINNLIATNITADDINLNGGVLTTSEDGTVLTLNGVAIGSEGVISVLGDAPIAVSAGQNPVVSLNDSGVSAGTYTLAQITVDSKGLITEAENGTIPPNDDWSNFPAQSDVDINGKQLDNVSKIVGDTSLILSAATDIIVDPLFGTFRSTSRAIRILAVAPQGQEVSDSTLEIETDNDMTITATDALSITAGTMTINNAVDMTSHKLTNVATPTDVADAATKAYVDGLATQTVKLSGDQSISGVKTFLTLPETSIGATLPSQFVNKAYVDAITPPTPGLGTVLNVSNVASKDIDMGGYDIANVNDITMNGLVPTITGSNIAGNMVIAAANTMNITTAGQMTLAAGGVMSIGGATYTTLENLNIDNSVIKKETGTDDLTIRDVGAIFMGGSGAINFAEEVVLTGTGLKVLTLTDGTSAPLPNVLGYDIATGSVKYQPATATPGLADVLAVSNLTGGTTIDSSTGIVLANELEVATIKALGFPLNTDVGIEANVVFPNDAAINFQGLGTITSGAALEINAGAGEDVIQFKSYTEFQKGITMAGAFPLEVKNGTGIAGYLLKTNGAGDAPEWVSLTSLGVVKYLIEGTNISIDNTNLETPIVSLNIGQELDMKLNAITNATSVGFTAGQTISRNAANIDYNTSPGGQHNFKVAGTNKLNITTNGIDVAGGITASNNITTGGLNYVATNSIKPTNSSPSLLISGQRPNLTNVPVQITSSAGLALGTTASLGTTGQYLKSNGAAQPTWADLPTTAVPTLEQVLNQGATASTDINMNGNDLTNVASVSAQPATALTLQSESGIILDAGVAGTVSTANRFSTSKGLALTGTTAPIVLQGESGSAGQYLASAGTNATPVWTDLPAGGVVDSITAGSNISVDSADPANPTVSVAISSTLDMNNQSITELKDITLNNGATITNAIANNIQLKASPTSPDLQITTQGVRTTGYLDAAGNGLRVDTVSPLTPNATDNTITVSSANVALQARLKVGINADPGLAGQLLSSTGNSLAWVNAPSTGVQSVDGIGNIAVDNTDAANPIVSFDVIEDIAMNGSSITGANEVVCNKITTQNIVSPDAVPLVITATNEDLQLESGAGKNIILVGETIFKNGIDLAADVGSYSALKVQGNAGTVGQVLASAGTDATPNWINIPKQGIYANTVYVNDNVNDIQSAVDSATQGDAIMVGAGSYGGSTLTITGKQNIAIICPNRANGQTITELAAGRGLTIAPNCTGSITIASLQIEGLLTLGGTGNYYFQNVQALAGITITAGTTGTFFFQNCEVAGLITIPNTFAGAIVFGQTNMTGATYSLNNLSPLQVQFALCTGLPTSRPTNATYGSTNSDTALTITTDTNILKVGGSVGTANQVLTSQGAGLPTIWADATGGGGQVNSVVGSTNISVDSADPANPIVSLAANLAGVSEVASATNTDLLLSSTGGDIVLESTNPIKNIVMNNDLTVSNINGKAGTIFNITSADGIALQTGVAGGQITIGVPTDEVYVQGSLGLVQNTPFLMETNPGTAGQFLQSRGAGITPIWATGGGGGGGQVNSVVAGSNISVDSTDAANPVVSLAVSSDINMNTNNITGAGTITATGVNTSSIESATDITINATGVGGTVLFPSYTAFQKGILLDGATAPLEAGNGAGASGQILISQGSDTPIWSDLPVSQVSSSSPFITAETTAGLVSIGASNLICEKTATNTITNNSSSIAIQDGVVMGNTTDTTYPNMRTFYSQTASSNKNIAIGSYAMVVPPTQTIATVNNSAIGVSALYPFLSTGDFTIARNVAVGEKALGAFTGASLTDNTAVGYFAGSSGTGVQRTVVGSLAGSSTAGTTDGCVIIGYNAGTGSAQTSSVIVGSFAGRSMTGGGSRNIALGNDVGLSSTGSQNIYIGSAGCYRIAGSNNIIIGHGLQANGSTTVVNNRFQIGNATNPFYLNGTIATPATTGSLAFAGNASFGTVALTNTTVAPTAGGSSGVHLPIVINGTTYKIALLNN